MYEYEIRIPLERVAVLIGPKGNIKKKIQNKLGIKLNINSEEGDVLINGDDNFNLLIAQNIIKAIGRGFNPDIALNLLNEDFSFELIDISDYCKTKNDLIRIRARAIGERGKARRLISKLTNTNIVIYGKTIGIIGKYIDVDLTKRAFDKLLNGSSHGKVFSFIQKELKNLR